MEHSQATPNTCSSSVIPQPLAAGIATTICNMCSGCRQTKPITEFLNPRYDRVLKNCTLCRQKSLIWCKRSIAKRNARVETENARLEAERKAQAVQDQNPVQKHGLIQSQIPITNEAYPQMPLPSLTVVNQAKFVISGLLQQESFANPCDPSGPSEETQSPEETVSRTPTPIKSEEKDSGYGGGDDEEEEETATTVPTPVFFQCLHCGVWRGACGEYSGICIYCLEHEQKWCLAGYHETDRPEFVGADGVEYEDCNGCRGRSELAGAGNRLVRV